MQSAKDADSARRRKPDPEPGKLAGDLPVAPARVLVGESQDELADLIADPRPRRVCSSDSSSGALRAGDASEAASPASRRTMTSATEVAGGWLRPGRRDRRA